MWGQVREVHILDEDTRVRRLKLAAKDEDNRLSSIDKHAKGIFELEGGRYSVFLHRFHNAQDGQPIDHLVSSNRTMFYQHICANHREQ